MICILVFKLSETIGLNPRGYPGSLLEDFRDSVIVLEYENLEKAWILMKMEL